MLAFLAPHSYQSIPQTNIHPRGNRHGPPFLRRLSSLLSKRLTTWQTVVMTMLYLYTLRNLDKVIGLESPEPLANLYSRSYFRATWITTALDAGFWSAMRIRPKPLRDLLSVAFSVYYLFCAEQADVKVRNVRATLTVDHLRVSWDKGQASPYLRTLTSILRPRFMRYPPRALRIARPRASAYTAPVAAWLYFDGPLSALKKHTKIVLDVPGGGFVAMNPRTHDDKLMAWAGKTGLPVLSLNYRKAPEYPYPYALNECYDVYYALVSTHGRCVGLDGKAGPPRIVLAGDSAGANLAVATLLMILQSGGADAARRWAGEGGLPVPEGLVLVYPALDMNIGNWMTDEQMALIKDRRSRKTNRRVLNRKSEDWRRLTPDTPHVSDDEDAADENGAQTGGGGRGAGKFDSNTTVVPTGKSAVHPSAGHISGHEQAALASSSSGPQPLKTRLAISSMISYFNDRILTPEMMRAMIILYIGPHTRPDFSTDYLLSPLLAPDALLARFPRTCILTGERDPLVDDTVIFAGRLRQAKRADWRERAELGLHDGRRFDEDDVVTTVLVPGISHGFLQFVSVFPEGWTYIYRCARWITEIFDRVDREAEKGEEGRERMGLRGSSYFDVGRPGDGNGSLTPGKHHYRRRTMSSGDEDRPLTMSRIAHASPGPGSSPRRDGSAANGVKLGSASPHPSSSGATTGTPSGLVMAASTEGVKAGRVDRKEREKGKGSVAGKSKLRDRRRKSLVRLASEEDLLGRRMKGLTGGLLGIGNGSNVPPTP